MNATQQAENKRLKQLISNLGIERLVITKILSVEKDESLQIVDCTYLNIGVFLYFKEVDGVYHLLNSKMQLIEINDESVRSELKAKMSKFQ